MLYIEETIYTIVPSPGTSIPVRNVSAEGAYKAARGCSLTSTEVTVRWMFSCKELLGRGSQGDDRECILCRSQTAAWQHKSGSKP
jgi:hypothetical protein